MALLQYLSNNPVIQQELKQSLLDLIQKTPPNFKSSLKTNLNQMRPVEITQTRKFKNEYLTQVLGDCALFSNTPQLKMTDFEVVTVPHNTVLMKQGDQPDFFYIVKSGKVDVYKDDKKINTVETDQYFGELAFMFETTRQATVVANGSVELYRLPRDKLKL